MKTAVFAWVLVIGFGYNYGFAVPGIASRDECVRLGNDLNAGRFFPETFDCHRYEVAR